MKKFLVILMVVAMASFLFVGCIPSVTPEVEEEEEEEEEVVVPTSSTPVLTAVETSAAVAIFDVTSTATLYMNIAEVGGSILVKGTAPAESVVKIYIDGVALISVAETTVTGLWTIAIAKTSLGDDGVKVMTAKVTEVGLAESAASNAVTFTLDTVKPSATTLAATADSAVGATGGTSLLTAGGTAILTAANTTVASIVSGTWVINVLGDSGVANNVTITKPDGTTSTYTQVPGSAVFAVGAPIPGVTLTFVAQLAPGQQSTVTCLAENTAIADRARVYFSEEITNASAIAIANYTFTVAGAANVPTPVSYADRYMYFSPFATPLVLNGVLGVSVNGVVDSAGNIQTTASALTCTTAAAHLTSLAP